MYFILTILTENSNLKVFFIDDHSGGLRGDFKLRNVENKYTEHRDIINFGLDIPRYTQTTDN